MILLRDNLKVALCLAIRQRGFDPAKYDESEEEETCEVAGWKEVLKALINQDHVSIQ